MFVLVASTSGRMGTVAYCPVHHFFSGYRQSGYQRWHSNDLHMEVVLQHICPGIMDYSGACYPSGQGKSVSPCFAYIYSDFSCAFVMVAVPADSRSTVRCSGSFGNDG